MNEWVWTVPVKGPAERLLLVTIAHFDEKGEQKISQKSIYAITGMASASVSKARTRLIEQGYLFYRPISGHPGEYQLRPPGYTPTLEDLAKAAPVERPPTTANQQTAKMLVGAWWRSTSPEPMIPGGFPSAIKIVRVALDAGHHPTAIGKALRRVPTLTTGSLEFALRRNEPIDTAEPGPTRNVQPSELRRCPIHQRLTIDCGCRSDV